MSSYHISSWVPRSSEHTDEPSDEEAQEENGEDLLGNGTNPQSIVC